ncbi:hypothetical protein F5Y04DRAFT_44472 [Hypomontagnella monticulosa]|nr:hypothetical protein F5Y04DRAFT_44472 [Hypomontagnella monticulosa]
MRMVPGLVWVGWIHGSAFLCEGRRENTGNRSGSPRRRRRRRAALLVPLLLLNPTTTYYCSCTHLSSCTQLHTYYYSCPISPYTTGNADFLFNSRCLGDVM